MKNESFFCELLHFNDLFSSVLFLMENLSTKGTYYAGIAHINVGISDEAPKRVRYLK